MQLIRRKVPYTIVASNGAVVKTDPSMFGVGKSNARGITMSTGDSGEYFICNYTLHVFNYSCLFCIYICIYICIFMYAMICSECYW